MKTIEYMFYIDTGTGKRARAFCIISPSKFLYFVSTHAIVGDVDRERWIQDRWIHCTICMMTLVRSYIKLLCRPWSLHIFLLSQNAQSESHKGNQCEMSFLRNWLILLNFYFKNWQWPGVVVHDLILALGRERQEGEFRFTLVYEVHSWPARATCWDPVLK